MSKIPDYSKLSPNLLANVDTLWRGAVCAALNSPVFGVASNPASSADQVVEEYLKRFSGR